ncbi:MAG: tRNA pseudouridine(38-40) synthase TruA [Candidatus Acidulodesulfobacterium sp.]
MNYLAVIEYCGTNYEGWQSQTGTVSRSGAKTVENDINKAIKIFTGADTKLLVSGRTDAGVHALNQVVNFKLPFFYDTNKFKIALNGILPHDISIKNIETVHDSFHATRDVLSKTYLYKINSGFRSPMLINSSWFVKEELNFDLMNRAASLFLGMNDFFNFTRKDGNRENKNYNRIITGIKICKESYGYDIFIEGGGFLRNMVRRIVGALIFCGTGKTGIDCLKKMLQERNFICNSVCAPSCGLFLHSVKYKHKIYC